MATSATSRLGRSSPIGVSPRAVTRRHVTLFRNDNSHLTWLSPMSHGTTPSPYYTYGIKYIFYTSIEREEKVGDRPRRLAKSFMKFCHQRGAPTLAVPRENSVTRSVSLGDGPRGDA